MNMNTIRTEASSAFLYSFVNTLQELYEAGESYEVILPLVYNQEKGLFVCEPRVYEIIGEDDDAQHADFPICDQWFHLTEEQVYETFKDFMGYMDTLSSSEENLGVNLHEFVMQNFNTMMHQVKENPTKLLFGFDICLKPGDIKLSRWLSPLLFDEDGILTIDVIEEHQSYYSPDLPEDILEKTEGEDPESLGELMQQVHKKIQLD